MPPGQPPTQSPSASLHQKLALVGFSRSPALSPSPRGTGVPARPQDKLAARISGQHHPEGPFSSNPTSLQSFNGGRDSERELSPSDLFSSLARINPPDPPAAPHSHVHVLARRAHARRLRPAAPPGLASGGRGCGGRPGGGGTGEGRESSAVTAPAPDCCRCLLPSAAGPCRDAGRVWGHHPAGQSRDVPSGRGGRKKVAKDPC